MASDGSQERDTSSFSLLSYPSPTAESMTHGFRGLLISTNHTRDSADGGLASPHEIVENLRSPVLSGSPGSRAGLLQPTHYIPPSTPLSARHEAIPHSQDDIRSFTMQISNMAMSPQSSLLMRTPQLDMPPASLPMPLASKDTPYTSEAVMLTSSLQSGAPGGVPQPSPARSPQNPSGLSILLSQKSSPSSSDGMKTPVPHKQIPAGRQQNVIYPSSSKHQNLSVTPHASRDDLQLATETSPLLNDVEAMGRVYTPHDAPLDSVTTTYIRKPNFRSKIFSRCTNVDLSYILTTAVRSIPAVILGILMNVLDGISYGLIIFPTSGIFADLGGIGVSMFFVTAVISQLVYSSGGSSFAGANGSMMIEVVPFFHIIATSLAKEIGENNRSEVIATCLAAFAFSSILTGFTFFLLGALRLGVLIGFFPRHILIGCIGGVGVFLILTGFTVSTRMEEDDIHLDYETFEHLFLDGNNLALWLSSFVLAALLRIITHKYHHQLIFPAYFIIIPIVFYFVILVGHMDLSHLRETGWLFTTGGGRDPWYTFYTLFDFKLIQWGAFWSTFPTQLALLFFNILHPPLNVPALSVSLGEDVNTDKELMAHGYSNLLAGFLGTVPNYLVYVNTLLFYRVGGDTRIAGYMLAAATAALLFVGTEPISFIPVIVVGALIFVLGIDLVKEAVWDTRHRVNRMEYITIVAIMACMTIWDFVSGVLFGIVVSCFFFVVQNSQQRSIRALHTGETAMSTVRRPSAHRAYLREVSKQTSIVRLQGFLFFGTITHTEETIRKLFDEASWAQNPIRFLVLDFSLVYGVDVSSAEAFVRVQRLLQSKGVVLVFCGLPVDSLAIVSLRNVGLLDIPSVELFTTYNDAMEWTENVYLRAWFSSHKEAIVPVELPGRQDTTVDLSPNFTNSPRRSHLYDAGWRTIGDHGTSISSAIDSNIEPFPTFAKAFCSDPEFDPQQFTPLIPYLERVNLSEGHVLWNQGDPSDSLYMIESGVLRAIYRFADHVPPTEESMVAGTLAGELSGLSGLERNATVVVERHAVLWRLGRDSFLRLQKEKPELAHLFTNLVMRAAKIDYDILLSALAMK